MTVFIARRLLNAIPLLFLISIVVFVVIKLPPTDYLDLKIAELQRQGALGLEEVIRSYRERYGLDKPAIVQYWTWISNFVQGDFGTSFEHMRPVRDIVWERLPITIIFSIITLVFIYVVAIPIGVYSATRQYSFGDYFFTGLSFIGTSTPNFLLALIVMFAAVMYGNQSVGGLFSPEYYDAPWSVAKFWDMMKHVWIPVVVVGTSGTAGLIRIMRANLLEVLGHQYITTARAKGVREMWVVYKHAFRVAVNPLISIIGLSIPRIIEGDVLVATIMNLPTVGPVFLQSLRQLDMYLAGSFLMFLAIMLLLGNLLADVLLAWADPRIRFE